MRRHDRPQATVIAPVISLAVVICASPALADRPGTPNQERGFTCNDELLERPSVCFELYNAASEAVTFENEAKVNGTPVPYEGMTGDRRDGFVPSERIKLTNVNLILNNVSGRGLGAFPTARSRSNGPIGHAPDRSLPISATIEVLL